jgi:hypothetical protein
MQEPFAGADDQREGLGGNVLCPRLARSSRSRINCSTVSGQRRVKIAE